MVKLQQQQEGIKALDHTQTAAAPAAAAAARTETPVTDSAALVALGGPLQDLGATRAAEEE